MATEAQKRANAKWNKANRKNIACSVSLDEYDAFKRHAEQQGKTISAVLLEYVRSCIAENLSPEYEQN